MIITGNTVFIPGATSGIGLGLARRLHRRGNTVVVGGRRRERLEQIAEEDPGIGTVHIDTADPVSIRAAAESVLDRYPHLNVLITMAGIMEAEDLHHPDFLATAEAAVTTNLLGPLRLLSAFIDQLRAQPAATIMTVSSGLAFVPLPLTPTYCATKAAIHSFTQSLRVQLADTDIEVLELAPPGVATELMDRSFEGQMSLEDFCDEVIDILENQPEAEEVLVAGVRPLRNAEADGTHRDLLAVLSAG